jgi:SAM-dependent methyltransferase
MLSSGIPGVDEYLRLDESPDFRRLLDASRKFRDEFEAREVFSKLYSIKWVDDPFLQWSRRWEYVYVLQRLEHWWQQNPAALDVADAGSGFTFFPFYLRQIKARAHITCIDADPTAGRAIDDAARVLDGGPDFSLQDLEKLDQPDTSLDAVFSVSAIEHTANPGRVVEEIHRVLRPGGVFVCTFDVSFETSSPMHVMHVDQLVIRLHELFAAQDGDTGSIADNAAKPDRVTTQWVAKEYPERLPWRNPLLVWIYDAIRGRFRSTLYRPMTFYCGTFVKKV